MTTAKSNRRAGSLTCRGGSCFTGFPTGIINKSTWLLILVLLIGISAGCSPPKSEPGVFYTAGAWEIPPAYHGNPWAPGGCGVASSYVLEPLFVYLPQSEIYIPRLAESFQESPDGLTLKVRLRENVRWHDGKPFGSRDVLTTFHIGYIKGLALWQNLDTIECPDDRTVVFRWRKVSPNNTIWVLTEKISSPRHIFGKWADMAVPLIEKRLEISHRDLDSIKEFSRKQRDLLEVLYRHHPPLPVGTGPFILKRVTASDMVLEKNPQHYDASNIRIKRVRILRWSSNEAVWSYLMSGDIDAVSPACPHEAADEILKRNPGMRLITPSDMSEFGLIFNCRTPPTGDINFRRAVAHILDRDLLRQVAYYYGDTESTYSLGMVNRIRHKWLDDDFYRELTRYDHDSAMGEKLLTDSGYERDPRSGRWLTPGGESISLEIIAPAGQNDMVLLAEASSSELTKFGIPANVRVVPMEIYSMFLRDGNFDIATAGGAQQTKYSHPIVSYNRFYRKGDQIQTAAGLPSKIMGRRGMVDTNRLSRRLEFTTDPAQSREMVQELAWITNEHLPFLTCYGKNLQVFILDDRRIVGWPADDDKIWEALPGEADTIYCTLITMGILRPAGGGDGD